MRKRPWTTGQAIGFLAAMAGVCIAAYGAASWPIHDEWGWWPWVVCGDWAEGADACIAGREDGFKALAIAAAGALLVISGLVAFRKTAAPVQEDDGLSDPDQTEPEPEPEPGPVEEAEPAQ